MKAGSGYIFVLQDALNTCCYAAHGGTFSVWDSGSRFAVAGQNKVLLEDGETPAPGLSQRSTSAPPTSTPLSTSCRAAPNSLHVVMGLAKPDARGELEPARAALPGQVLHERGRRRAGVRLRPGAPRSTRTQYRGNVARADRAGGVARATSAPFLAREVAPPWRAPFASRARRSPCACGQWRRWRYDEAFMQLVPRTVARKLVKRGVTPPQLEQIVQE